MDKAFLEDCLARGMSLKAIAAEVGRAPGTVGYWIRKHGLVAIGSEKYDPRSDLDSGDLKALIAEGLTLKEIAARVNRSPSAISKAIRRLGLEGTRHSRRAAAIREARAAGRQTISLDCPVHGHTDFWVGRTATRCRKCNAEGVARRRRKVKEILVEEAGGCCVLCGFNASLAALEFHHLDPATKAFAVSNAGITRSIESCRDEARKCVLLCANCHAQVEVGALEVPVAFAARDR